MRFRKLEIAVKKINPGGVSDFGISDLAFFTLVCAAGME